MWIMMAACVNNKRLYFSKPSAGIVNFQAHRVSELLLAAGNYGMTDLSDMWSEDKESVIRSKATKLWRSGVALLRTV